MLPCQILYGNGRVEDNPRNAHLGDCWNRSVTTTESRWQGPENRGQSFWNTFLLDCRPCLSLNRILLTQEAILSVLSFVSGKARRVFQISWNWSYTVVNYLMWVLGTDLRSLAKAVHTLNHWAISPETRTLLLQGCRPTEKWLCPSVTDPPLLQLSLF